MQYNWYEAAVSANAPRQIISVVDWASDSPTPLPPSSSKPATYNVFAWGTNDPSEGNHSITTENFDVLASPVGWHSLPYANDPPFHGVRLNTTEFYRNTTTTWGNNVCDFLLRSRNHLLYVRCVYHSRSLPRRTGRLGIHILTITARTLARTRHLTTSTIRNLLIRPMHWQKPRSISTLPSLSSSTRPIWSTIFTIGAFQFLLLNCNQTHHPLQIRLRRSRWEFSTIQLWPWRCGERCSHCQRSGWLLVQQCFLHVPTRWSERPDVFVPINHLVGSNDFT